MAQDTETREERQIEGKKKKRFRIIHNHELCKACGLCIEYCPVKGIEADILGKAQFTHPERCIGCRKCVYYCPDFANWVEELDEMVEEGVPGAKKKEDDGF